MALAGESGDVVAGTGLLMVKVCAAEVPPPGVGLKTVTKALPPVVMSAAGTVACSCVAVWETITRLLPFHRTWEDETKLEPVTVSVKAGPNAMVLVGESGGVMTGAGLSMVNVCALEVPPPGVGLKTVTEAVPPFAMSEAGTVACSCVAVWETIARLLPFHITWEDGIKLEPVTVSVKAAVPAMALAGDSGDVVAGTGLSTQNEIGEEVPPPGAGVNTVTG
jgi:hypothetical protein